MFYFFTIFEIHVQPNLAIFHKADVFLALKDDNEGKEKANDKKYNCTFQMSFVGYWSVIPPAAEGGKVLRLEKIPLDKEEFNAEEGGFLALRAKPEMALKKQRVALKRLRKSKESL